MPHGDIRISTFSSLYITIINIATAFYFQILSLVNVIYWVTYVYYNSLAMQQQFTSRLSLSGQLTALIFLILSTPVLMGLAYGQISPKSRGSHVVKPLNSSKPISTAHNVRITSPTKGEKVPAGKAFEVSGISVGNHNATLINCHVSVIVNGIKPYQTATANGLHGSNDYSKWIFIIGSNHTTVKLGQNKITAKYSCADGPNMLSHYSINITGIGTSMRSVTGVK